jgi:RES domain
LVYRGGRGDNAFAPPPWEYVFEDGTFHNRYDDPRADRDVPEKERFRVLYCATRRAGAYGETIAPYRKNPRLRAELEEIADDEPLDPELEGGIVPKEFRSSRVIGTTRLYDGSLFANVADGRTMTILRTELWNWVVELGLPDFDLSAATSKKRRLTQKTARYVYELADEGHTHFNGIRYPSRLHEGWELWAIFHDRMEHSPVEVAGVIEEDDPELQEAANVLGINIERGH